MALRPITGLALCAGVGGLELGLKLALGERYRTVCYVERDAYAASVLVARMADKALDSAPIWDDLESFDGRWFRSTVDIVSAGFPCQPASTAGKRKGDRDERWVWPLITDILRDTRPRVIFLENVRGLIQCGLAQVLGSLADLGFDVEWGMFKASEVGAPHFRPRVFILAHSRSEPLRIEPGRGGGQDREDPPEPARDFRWSREPGIHRVDDGTPYRVDRLRCLGNAVVPQQAALAFRELWGRIAT